MRFSQRRAWQLFEDARETRDGVRNAVKWVKDYAHPTCDNLYSALTCAAEAQADDKLAALLVVMALAQWGREVVR